MVRVVDAGISYPDLTGYNLVQCDRGSDCGAANTNRSNGGPELVLALVLINFDGAQ